MSKIFLNFQDPEGILASPVGGHIARRRSQKSLAETEREQAIMEQMRQAKREVFEPFISVTKFAVILGMPLHVG